MVAKKTKSHRQSLRKKYMIQKKVKEYKKKLKRAGKKNPNHRKKLKRDPGIPNLCPFKEDLLRQIIKEKEKRNEMEDIKRLRKKAERRKKDAQSRRTSWQERQEQEIGERKKKEEQYAVNHSSSSGKRWYFRELKKVIETADVILEILDARDPLGCRCPQIEDKIITQQSRKLGEPKKVVLVLNKIDLIPAETAEKWLKLLRREYPTIAFKSSTQDQKRNLGHSFSKSKVPSNTHLNSSRTCIGADVLVQLLKNYCRSLNLKQSISVGVIGYPNVGKSSVINSLKRTKAAGTSATPGFTKAIQELHLDKHITLLDSPGVIFSKEDDSLGLILRNVLKVEKLESPITAAETIVSRCPSSQLREVYEIPEFSNAEEFLIHIANRRGKLKKGGVPDLVAAARSALQDWNEGKIKYYCQPPSIPESEGTAKIVQSFGKEFDIDALLSKNSMEVETLKLNEPNRSDALVFESRGYGNLMSECSQVLEKESTDDVMQMEDEEKSLPQLGFLPTKEKSSEKFGIRTAKPTKPSVIESLNPQLNKEIRVKQKQERKDKRKKAQKSQDLMEDENEDDTNEEETAQNSDYDFDVDFIE